MKKKFWLCFLGCILAGLLSTGSVGAYSLLSDGNLENSANETEIALSGEVTETNATLDNASGACVYNGNQHRHRYRNGQGSHAPIPSAILLLGSGILGLVGIRIRSRKRS